MAHKKQGCVSCAARIRLCKLCAENNAVVPEEQGCINRVPRSMLCKLCSKNKAS